MQTITFQDMLRELSASDQPFSITFCTCNQKRKTGGEMVSLPNVINPAVRIAIEKADKPRPVTEAKGKTKNSANAIRNLVNVDANRVVCVHIDLITEFNGKRVIR